MRDSRSPSRKDDKPVNIAELTNQCSKVHKALKSQVCLLRNPDNVCPQIVCRRGESRKGLNPLQSPHNLKSALTALFFCPSGLYESGFSRGQK